MGSKDLKRVINQYLFAPLSDELVELLHDIALMMTENIDTGKVETYARSFFFNEASYQFQYPFNQKFKEKYGEGLQLPTIVYVILEMYVIGLCIDSDTMNVSLKNKFSLIVKNTAVLRKGNWKGIVCPDWVLKVYNYSNQNRCKTINCTQSFSQLINAVVPCNNWAETGLDIMGQEVYNQIRGLCAAGVRGRVASYVNNDEYKSLDNPFACVYVLVIKMVKEWNWKYIETNPVKKLNEVLGNEAKKRKNLNNIADDIRNRVNSSYLIKPTMKSSILLKRVNDGTKSKIEGTKFSALEFGVYLYYEMLLETT